MTSRPDQADALRTDYPAAEIRVANYLDAADMRAVFAQHRASFAAHQERQSV